MMEMDGWDSAKWQRSRIRDKIDIIEIVKLDNKTKN